MMKPTLKIGLCLVICFTLILGCGVSALNDTSISWYTVRNKEHKQPLLPLDLKIIEDYHGIYIDHSHRDFSGEKVVYLTFDAGYENGNVKKILDILKEEKTPGAFFILGNLIQKNPELVRQMTDDGHTVCNHTNHHKNMTSIDRIEAFQEELVSLENMYQDITGKELAKFYRPPEGRFDKRSLSFASQLGYTTVFWSLAYADWDNDKQPSPEKALNLLMDYMHNGAVILLHPTSKTNTLILKDLIQSLKHQGYRFGTLDELVKNIGL